MQRVVDVAAYILQKKRRLTGYQLQKLLYYCQAWCLATSGERLFRDPVQAWEHGPVVYRVYREHAQCYDVAFGDVPGDASAVDVRAALVIDAVLASYSGLNGEELERLSHSERPWMDAFDGTSSTCSPEIDVETMERYYSHLMASGESVRAAHHVPRFDCPQRICVSDATLDWLSSIV